MNETCLVSLAHAIHSILALSPHISLELRTLPCLATQLGRTIKPTDIFGAICLLHDQNKRMRRKGGKERKIKKKNKKEKGKKKLKKREKGGKHRRDHKSSFNFSRGFQHFAL
jgi:hypothetical protein